MPTGACGVDCEVCKLHLLEICSSCGPGRSPVAAKKLEAQKRILGSPCPVLACASLKQIDFCLRDCVDFPCVNFSSGPYPFSASFLAMQERRRTEPPPPRTHNRTPLNVPDEYWDRVAAREASLIRNAAGVTVGHDGGWCLQSFHETLWVDTSRKRVCRRVGEEWVAIDDALRELVILLYLMNIEPMRPGLHDLIGVGDLKEAHYFRGPHALDLRGLLERYGHDARGFREAAAFLGGELLDMADAAVRLRPCPQAPVYFLLYEGDEEFQPKITVMFERTIEGIFSASGIWSLVKVAANHLLRGPERRWSS